MTRSAEGRCCRFTGIDRAAPGILARMLADAYAGLLATDPERWNAERAKWDAFDREAFASPAVGACVFLTWADGAVAGFGSYDPRGAPARARIGHHCIAPGFQGRGLGRRQFDEILRRLAGVAELHASTLDLPFFAAARHLYGSAGFRVVERTPWTADPRVGVIQFVRRDDA